jgi:hypothetical protein
MAQLRQVVLDVEQATLAVAASAAGALGLRAPPLKTMAESANAETIIVDSFLIRVMILMNLFSIVAGAS